LACAVCTAAPYTGVDHTAALLQTRSPVVIATSSSLSSTFIAYHCIYTAKQLQSRQKLLGIIHKCGHGRGVFKLVGPTGYSYSGRPQTVLFWITIVTFCCPATWLRLNGPVIPFYYRPIMNLVLQSNFEFCMFCLLIILIIH